eukprot:6475646-Amphidinium_carterae.2
MLWTCVQDMVLEDRVSRQGRIGGHSEEQLGSWIDLACNISGAGERERERARRSKGFECSFGMPSQTSKSQEERVRVTGGVGSHMLELLDAWIWRASAT